MASGLTDAERAKAVVAAKRKCEEADKAYQAVIKEMFPIGAYVRWSERPYIKAGTVIGYSLTGHSIYARNSTNGGRQTVTMTAIALAVLDDI